MVEVFVSRLGFDSASESYVVVLQEKGGTRLLPIWIGKPEADSIIRHIQHVKPPRPLAHDLVQSLIVGLGAHMLGAHITRVEDRTYFAELLLERDGSTVTIDARPSDSIAIALRLGAPIRAAEQLLLDPGDEAATDEEGSASDAADELSTEQLKRYLEALRPEDFGKFNP